jgi:hypothetical protein
MLDRFPAVVYTNKLEVTHGAVRVTDRFVSETILSVAKSSTDELVISVEL